MRKTLTAVMLAAVFGMSGAVEAADPYTDGKSASQPYLPLIIWAGYAGANGGYAWSTGGDVSHVGLASDCGGLPGCIVGVPLAAEQASTSPEGGFGGGQLGYNWQAGRWVFGLETVSNRSSSVSATTLSNTSSSSANNNTVAASGAMAPPTGYSASQLIFEDQFTSATLDMTKWTACIGETRWGCWNDQGNLPSPYSGSNHGGEDIEYVDPYPAGYATNTAGNHTVTGNGGGLRLIATPSSKFAPNYSWATGYVVSAGKFSIPSSGGYVQFKAKMPDSRYGAWGTLWFLDGSAEIDLQESGTCGGCQGSDSANRILAMRVFGSGNQVTVDTGVDLSAGYHIYGMEYRPGQSIKMYLDGKLEHTWTSGVPTGAYEIVMGVQIAQDVDWHTVVDSAHPGPFEEDVSDVQVYSLP